MDREYYSKVEKLYDYICESRCLPNMKDYDEEIDILFHYMSCHINNKVEKCIFLDEYENIFGSRKHEDILKSIDAIYKVFEVEMANLQEHFDKIKELHFNEDTDSCLVELLYQYMKELIVNGDWSSYLLEYDAEIGFTNKSELLEEIDRLYNKYIIGGNVYEN